jgi:hypothetical protein
MKSKNDVGGVEPVTPYWSWNLFSQGVDGMNSSGMTDGMFLDDDQRNRVMNTLDALQNLLYLIRLDASEPDRVLAYVTQVDAMLSRMHTLMVSEDNPV